MNPQMTSDSKQSYAMIVRQIVADYGMIFPSERR
jgi:hypothetical protein